MLVLQFGLLAAGTRLSILHAVQVSDVARQSYGVACHAHAWNLITRPRRACLKLQPIAICELGNGVQWAQLLLEVLRKLLLLLAKYWNSTILVCVLLQLSIGHGPSSYRTCSDWMDITLESPLGMLIVHLIEAAQIVRPLSLCHLTISLIVCV